REELPELERRAREVRETLEARKEEARGLGRRAEGLEQQLAEAQGQLPALRQVLEEAQEVVRRSEEVNQQLLDTQGRLPALRQGIEEAESQLDQARGQHEDAVEHLQEEE